MLVLKSKIRITQQPSTVWPDRNKYYDFNFLTSCEIVSTWQNLSDTCTLTVPQKVQFVDDFGQTFDWMGKKIGGGGDNTAPLIFRGDKLTIYLGYNYYDTSKSQRVTEFNMVFDGWVNEVESKAPITIKAVDNMWKLTQVQAPNKTWTGKTLQEIIKELLNGTGFKLKETVSGSPVATKVGDFVTQNQTVAEVLEFMRKEYHIESFFRGTTLYSAAFRYWPEDVKDHVFRFQENIIDSELKYQRIDDVIMGVECHSVEKFSSGTRKDGQPKKGVKRLNVFALYERGKLKFYDEKPAGFQGEIRTLNLFAASKEELKTMAEKNVYRLIYTGFKGNFTTFGLPYVRHGDNIVLRNEILPDQDGTYKAKANTITFDQAGFFQKIEIDLRVDGFSTSEVNTGL